MSTSSSTSSSSPSPSSSSSSGSVCSGTCFCDPVTGIDCSTCDDTCICEVPFPIPAPMNVPCEEFDPMTFQRGMPVAAQLARAFVRVPIVSNPSQWRNVAITLASPVTRLPMLVLGWDITIIQGGGVGNTPFVTPNTVPTDAFTPLDKVLAASVTLPESTGITQYWVPVTERISFLGKRFAQLQTPGWTVIVLRDPA